MGIQSKMAFSYLQVFTFILDLLLINKPENKM